MQRKCTLHYRHHVIVKTAHIKHLMVLLVSKCTHMKICIRLKKISSQCFACIVEICNLKCTEMSGTVFAIREGTVTSLGHYF